MKKLITLILALALSTSAHAIMPDVFQGRVLDAETHEPLEGVHVEITEVIPGWAQSDETHYTDSLGRYRFRCGGMTNITIRARYFGYKTEVVHLKGLETGDTIRIEDILLQPSEVLLKEVIKGDNQRYFFMRGDTVVFNSDAFQMEDADHLLDLIQKMPGMSVEEDQLLWYGKPLQFMIGRTRFNRSSKKK